MGQLSSVWLTQYLNVSFYEIAILAVSSEVHVPELLTHRAMICRIIPWSCARINRVDGYRSDIFWVY